MYEYIIRNPQPPISTPAAPKPAAAPQPPPTLSRAQARAKERKEEQELRDWWDDLPEEKRQDVRNTKFWVTKPKDKKKPEKKKAPPKKEDTTPKKPDKPAEEKKYESLELIF